MSDQNYTDIDELVKKHKEDQHISLSKEGEPLFPPKESEMLPDSAANESEPKAEKEGNVEDYIQDAEDMFQLDPQLKKAGLQVVDGSKLSPFQKIQLPITDEKIMEGHEKPITSSWRWLSELLIYILGQSHIALKKIHGKVIRVLKR